MRIRYSLGIFLTIAATNGVAVYGCSADANAPAEDGPDASSADVDGSIDLGGSGDDTSGNEAGAKTDSGPKDAGLDAKLKPDVGPPGSPCNPIGTNQANPNGCGWCGSQSRVCLEGDAGAGIDAGVWSDWGACLNDHTGDPAYCDPSVADAGVESCGNCGHRQIICQLDCKKNTTLVCQGEPSMACSPGDTKFALAQGCTNPAQGRSSTCGSNCQWGAPSDCIDPPPNPNFATISNTTGQTVNKTFNLSPNDTLPRLDTGSCPSDPTGNATTPYIYIQVFNKDSKAHSVDIWTSSAGTSEDNVVGWYPTPAIPQTLAERKACSGKVNDSCTTSQSLTPSCSGIIFGGVVDGDAPTIPAGGSIEVYVGGYSTSVGTGDFILSMHTK